MYHNRIAAGHGRFERRYRRTDAIHDATSLLMARFGLDAGQAVAHLVRLSKQHSESIEAAAHMCVDAELRGVPQRAA